MKKVLLLFIAAFVAFNVHAQNIAPEFDHLPGKQPKTTNACDSLFTGWCIDINATGGFLFQDISSDNQVAKYNSALNAKISEPEFKNGVSRGLDVQVGYFFGKKRHFGIGSGLMYMYQQGDLVMDNFHIEYRAVDYFGNTYRQALTGNGKVKETLGISNLNIPLVFKYRTMFSKKVGMTIDAGFLVNLLEQNNYSTNSSFDYEAIYKYTGSQGSVVPVYDNSPIPAQGDLLMTKQQYLASNSSVNIQDYFNNLRGQGYNVGLGVKPSKSSGNVNFNGSVGILLRPSVSFCVSENVSLSVGLYYIYQDFTHSSQAGYQLTNKVGSYNSMLNNVTRSVNNSAGLNIGFRYCFNKKKPEPQPAAAPAPEEPPVASPATADEEAEEEPVDISTPILFDIDKADIKPQAYPVLEEAAKELDENQRASLVIHGYTDNTGEASYNRKLSKRRAAAVKSYLQRKGILPKKMKTVGHGEKTPAASNRSEEGRARNRRVIMKLKTGG